MQTIKTDIKRSLYNLPFGIAILAALLTVILGPGFQMLFPKGASEGLSPFYHSMLVEAGLSSDAMLMLVPILCTLPYTTAFLDDYTSGYLRFYLLRSEKGAYIKGKLLAVFLSGGLCLFVGIIAAYFLLYLFYSPLEILDTESISPFLGILTKALLFTAAGGFWASVGFWFANLTLSRYMAYAAPFVLDHVLVILQERYFLNLYVLNPKEWLTVIQPWPLGAWGVMIMLVLLSLIIMILNFNLMEGRVNHG